MSIAIILVASVIAVGLAAYIMQIVRLSPEARPTGRDPNWTDSIMTIAMIWFAGCIYLVGIAAVFAVCWVLALVLR